MRLWIPFALLGLLCLAGCFLFDAMALKVVSVYVAANFFILSAACRSGRAKTWFKREDGALSPMSYVLLLPLHFLNALSFFVATKVQREAPANQIAANLWLGRRMSSLEAEGQFGKQPLAVLDMTSEFAECRAFAAQQYLCLPTMDHRAPTQRQLQKAVEFIRVNRSDYVVYVHCALGHGRSATVVAAWMLATDAERSVDAAIGRLKSIRPCVRLNTEQREALEVFLKELRRIK